ncbi:MAG: arylsulfatase [Isosphaeraceae bacterium]|nr:arylsulfatase [Isosphaeraceae bacterium]
MIKHPHLGLILSTALVASWSAGRTSAADRPNIVVIMADDMGWSDLGCQGGEIDTPNLDRLARGGMRHTRFYNAARCCPTRAALLTGLYPHQAGIGHMMADRGSDAYRGELGANTVTIAEALRDTGYRTYMAGKWHVTKKIAPSAEVEKAGWPLHRGFDRFYGTIHGGGSYFDPVSLVRDDRLISAYDDPEYRPREYYYTDAISDHAVRFIGDHSRDHDSKPFFLYVAYTAPHWPMQAKAAELAKYRGRYDAGPAAIRKARLEKQRRLGLIVADLEPSPPITPNEGPIDSAFEARCMEVFAAMVDTLDQGVGRIVGELERTGRMNDTVILFLQDNGACAEGMGRSRKAPAPAVRAGTPSLPPMLASTLQTEMIPAQTRDGYPMRQGYGVLPGGADTFIAYGEAWAQVGNTPFREYKHWVHEGGISTPLIVHWPSGIAENRRGELDPQPSHLIDIMPTCLELAGATYPKTRAGLAITPQEGVSLLQAWRGKELDRGRPIFWEHEGNRAVCDGRWKLVAKHRGPWELYDIEVDRVERRDLAAREPDRVAKMSAAWKAWAKRVGVRPWPLTDAPKEKRP